MDKNSPKPRKNDSYESLESKELIFGDNANSPPAHIHRGPGQGNPPERPKTFAAPSALQPSLQKSRAQQPAEIIFPVVEFAREKDWITRLTSARDLMAAPWAPICGSVMAVLIFAIFLVWSILSNSRKPDPASAPHKKPTTVVATRSTAGVAQSPPAVSSSPSVNPTSATEVGTSNEWIGELERIWGSPSRSTELHFLIRLDTPLNNQSHVEGVVQDEAFANDVLDYVTMEERIEQSNDQKKSGSGDKVKMAGAAISLEQIEYRISPRGTPIVRLASIQRVGEPQSMAAVGSQRRPVSSFREPPEKLTLTGVLRVSPPAGIAMNLAGRFQEWERETETVLLSLGSTGRAAEIHFPQCDFSQYKRGDVANVSAESTGKVCQRVVNNSVIRRPYFTGTEIHRPEISQERIRSAPRSLAATPQKSDKGDSRSSNSVPAAVASSSAPSRPPSPMEAPRPRLRGSEIFIVSEEGKAALLDGDRWQVLKLPNPFPTKIKCVYLDQQHYCWLAGQGGVMILNGQELQTCSLDDGFPRETISCILQDRRGRMWVGSWGDGIACLASNDWRTRGPNDGPDKDSWKQYRRTDGLCRDDVNTLAEDGQGRLWIGTNSFGMVNGVPPGGGISILKDDRFDTGFLPDDIAQLQIQSMDYDKSGRLFVGFIGGMLIVEPNLTAKVITVDNGLPQRTPQATLCDSQGRLWAGTWGGGVVQIDVATAKVLPELALPEARQVRKICEDESGTIWTSALEGLWKLQKGSKWQAVRLPPGISQVGVVAAIPENIRNQLSQFSQ